MDTSKTYAMSGFLCPLYLGLPLAIQTNNRLNNVTNHVVDEIKGSSHRRERNGDGVRIPGIVVGSLFGESGRILCRESPVNPDAQDQRSKNNTLAGPKLKGYYASSLPLEGIFERGALSRE